MIEYKVIDNGISIKLNMDLSNVFDNGQTFRWNKSEEDSYIGVAYGRVLEVRREGENVQFLNTNEEDFRSIWMHYFDLETDYMALEKELKKIDGNMKLAVEYASGLRLLNQEPYEMLISFIISANNNIPRIKKIIEKLSSEHGEIIEEYKGARYYAFPGACTLSVLSVSVLKETGLGYRDRYVKQAATDVCENDVSLNDIKGLDTLSASKELKKILGVGQKVAECILLFGLEKRDVFPVDTWINKVLEELYPGEVERHGGVREFFMNHFGEHAGLAQQYLFHYMRTGR